jgi:hypothetical protein
LFFLFDLRFLMAKVYFLSDSKGIPFAAFTSMKAVFQYVDVNWYSTIAFAEEKRKEVAEATVEDFKDWPSAASMVADRRPYHFEGSSQIQTDLGTVAKRFRGEPSAKLVMRDSTGTLTWTLRMLTTIAAKR